MANKIIHKHSNVLTYDQKNQKTVAKLPSSSQLDYGELAINYARNYETISLKNSGNEIVEFKSKKYIDDRITETENKIEAVKELSDIVDSNMNKISGLQESIITLIGTEEGDDTKSVRNIAAEEVAKIVDDAPENYDTLKEIADYISSDATNAAAMVNDINFLKEITSGFTGENTIISVIEDNEETIAASITELENRMGNVEIGLETKSDIGHTHADYSVTGHAHDDIYYTEDEIDSMLLGYSLTAHTHNVVSSSANGFAPKVSDGGTIDNSSNDLVLTSDNGTVGWRKLPTNAFTDTDTKVTSPSNHYAPTGETGSTLTANASGASAAWSIDVVKGVTVERDSKGHITNLSVTSGKLPANPNTDTKVIQTVTTTNAEYPVLLAQSGQSSTTTGTTYFDSGITINPSTNTINATSTSSKKVDNSLVVKLNGGTTEGTNMFTFDGSTGKTVNVTAGVIGASSVNHAHGTIRLSGDVSGSGKITSGETAINITTTVANNSHSHTSDNISDSVSAITSNVSTKLVQEKAVYNLVSDTEEQISEVLLDHYSQITGLTENITNLVTEIENNELVTATSITELEDRMDNVEIGLETKSDIGHTHKGLCYTYDAGVIDSNLNEIDSAPSIINIVSEELTIKSGMLLDLSFRLSKTHVSNSSTPSYVIEKIIVNNSTEISLYYYLNNQSMLGYRYDVGAHRLLISIQNIDNYFYGYIFNVKSNFSDALASSKLIDGVYFNGSNNITHYAVCESAGSSAEKVIVLDGFEYTTGASIWVKFEKANTATSPYLTINGDTQKRYIRYGTGTAGANTQLNVGVWNLIWDGTVWRIHIPEMVNQSNKIKVQRWASATSNAMPLLFTNSGYANTSPDEPNNANNNTLSGTLASTSGYSETYIAAIANKPLLYQPSKGVLYAGNATVHVSDERLKNFKEDIQVDFNELKKIPKKYFTWKNDDNNELNIGTSAQELEKVYPELVSEYPEEGRAYKTVNYSNLSIIALAAIDKLNERIEYLETKLKYLENK